MSVRLGSEVHAPEVRIQASKPLIKVAEVFRLRDRSFGEIASLNVCAVRTDASRLRGRPGVRVREPVFLPAILRNPQH